eukprot:5997049-Lingulodinium_polyedra.AAC.1
MPSWARGWPDADAEPRATRCVGDSLRSGARAFCSHVVLLYAAGASCVHHVVDGYRWFEDTLSGAKGVGLVLWSVVVV